MRRSDRLFLSRWLAPAAGRRSRNDRCDFIAREALPLLKQSRDLGNNQIVPLDELGSGQDSSVHQSVYLVLLSRQFLSADLRMATFLNHFTYSYGCDPPRVLEIALASSLFDHARVDR